MSPNSVDYEPLRIIKNEVLTEVDFVIDYFRLVFESKILTVLANPIIIQNGVRYSIDSTEYYYRFVQGITRKVTDIELVENELVKFQFGGEYSIEIPYEYKTGAGIEIMQDIKDHSQWWGW